MTAPPSAAVSARARVPGPQVEVVEAPARKHVQVRIMERLQDDDRLTTVDVAVGMAVARNADHGTLKAWPAQDLIAKRAKCASSTARESLRRLGSLGVLSTIRKQTGKARARCFYTFNAGWLAEGLSPAPGVSYRRLPAGISTSTSDHLGGAPPSALPPPVPEPDPEQTEDHHGAGGRRRSPAPARETADTSAPSAVVGKTLHVCEDCGNQWPVEGRNGETYGPTCNRCGVNGVLADEWTCDDCDRAWSKSYGSVCVHCKQDAAGALGPHYFNTQQEDAEAEGRHVIADAEAEGRREGRREARQQFADRAQTPAERAVARENPPEPLIPITVDGLRARAAVLPTTTTTTKSVLVNGGAPPEVEVFSVDAAIAKASRNARRLYGGKEPATT